MSWPAKELTVLAATQRKKGQHEEALALASALAVTKANPDSANGWWQVALSRLALGDSRDAVPLWNGPWRRPPTSALAGLS
jgi:hypothetical protein